MVTFAIALTIYPANMAERSVRYRRDSIMTASTTCTSFIGAGKCCGISKVEGGKKNLNIVKEFILLIKFQAKTLICSWLSAHQVNYFVFSFLISMVTPYSFARKSEAQSFRISNSCEKGRKCIHRNLNEFSWICIMQRRRILFTVMLTRLLTQWQGGRTAEGHC